MYGGGGGIGEGCARPINAALNIFLNNNVGRLIIVHPHLIKHHIERLLHAGEGQRKEFRLRWRY
jgi:hypothetical protein